MNENRTESVFLNRLFELFICVFYTWYFLPICNVLLPNDRYKLIFFCFFAIGFVGLFLLGGIRINTVIVAVLSYIVVFTLLFVRGVGDSAAHIRVSFMFWGTALLCFGVLKEEGRCRIGKYLLLLFLITSVTSAVGVFLDNSAARTIAHVGADDALQNSFKMKNISSIYLFQCLVAFVPILVCLPKSRIQRALGFGVIAVILAVLLNASFTISLIIFLVALGVSVMQSGKSINRVILTGLFGVLAIIIWFNIADILMFLSSAISNAKISSKLNELSVILMGGSVSGDVSLRLELYKASFDTFLANPFGTGVYYSYVRFEDGIGYHSQIIDDMARYGIFALVFYVTFFAGYFRYLKNEWKKVDCSRVAGIVTLIYVAFLILNLGFRSSEESVVMLFILPVLPEIIIQHRKKRELRCSEERLDEV